MFEKVQQYAKFIVALIGAVVTSGVNLIPEEYSQWLTVVVAVLTAVAVYAVPNKPAVVAPVDVAGDHVA
jgi:uncharacterized membrane protein YadS